MILRDVKTCPRSIKTIFLPTTQRAHAQFAAQHFAGCSSIAMSDTQHEETRAHVLPLRLPGGIASITKIETYPISAGVARDVPVVDTRADITFVAPAGLTRRDMAYLYRALVGDFVGVMETHVPTCVNEASSLHPVVYRQTRSSEPGCVHTQMYMTLPVDTDIRVKARGTAEEQHSGPGPKRSKYACVTIPREASAAQEDAIRAVWMDILQQAVRNRATFTTHHEPIGPHPRVSGYRAVRALAIALQGGGIVMLRGNVYEEAPDNELVISCGGGTTTRPTRHTLILHAGGRTEATDFGGVLTEMDLQVLIHAIVRVFPEFTDAGLQILSRTLDTMQG